MSIIQTNVSTNPPKAPNPPTRQVSGCPTTSSSAKRRHGSSGSQPLVEPGGGMVSPPSAATLSALMPGVGPGANTGTCYLDREPTPSIGKDGGKAGTGGMEDYLWLCIRDCWAELPDDRPDFRQIRARLSPLRAGM